MVTNDIKTFAENLERVLTWQNNDQLTEDIIKAGQDIALFLLELEHTLKLIRFRLYKHLYPKV